MHYIGVLLICSLCLVRGRRVDRGPVFQRSTEHDGQSDAAASPLESLAALVLPLRPSAAFTQPLAKKPVLARHLSASSISASSRRSKSDAVMTSKSVEFAEFENLLKDQRKAELTKDYSAAAELRERLSILEESKPVPAVRWHMKRRVEDRLVTALALNGDTLGKRLEAIDALHATASHPVPISEAEDALHIALLRNDESRTVAARVENYLALLWRRSGNETVDAALQKAMNLTEMEKCNEAIEAYSKVIDMAPEFAESYHGRGITYMLAGDLTRARADFLECQRLQPRHFGCIAALAESYFPISSKEQRYAYGSNIIVAAEDLNADDVFEGLKWCRRCLVLHPRALVPPWNGMQAMIQNFEPRLLSMHQKPLMEKAVASIQEQTPSLPRWLESIKNWLWDPQEETVDDLDQDVSCRWDVHRVQDDSLAGKGSFQYFFRLRYRSSSETKVQVKSLGRFYVLQWEGGRLLTFSRPTPDYSDAQITLEPGEEHRLCWILETDTPLQSAAGGTTFQFLDDSLPYKQSFTEAGLRVVRPHYAQQIDPERVAELQKGHTWMGYFPLPMQSRQTRGE